MPACELTNYNSDFVPKAAEISHIDKQKGVAFGAMECRDS